MKTPDKYRFSLQWSAETEEKVRAGDFLEKLGNRKSEFIVHAVTEYLETHPEAVNDSARIQIIVKPSITQQQIMSMVYSIVEEKMSGITLLSHEAGCQEAEPIVTETDVEEMLKNLDMFSP